MVKKMAVMGLRHQRGRLAGHVSVLKRTNLQCHAKIERLHARIAANTEKIQTLVEQIDVLGSAAQNAFSAELAQPIPRQTVPKKHLASWGAVPRELLRQLQLAKGKPLSTGQLTHLVIDALALKLTPADFAHFRGQVRRSLKRLCDGGMVVRFSVAITPGDVTTWLLADSLA